MAFTSPPEPAPREPGKPARVTVTSISDVATLDTELDVVVTVEPTEGVAARDVIAALPPVFGGKRVVSIVAERCLTMDGADFSHLVHLKMLHAHATNVDAAAIATLPPSVLCVTVVANHDDLDGARFDHLPKLDAANFCLTQIKDETVQSLPPWLKSLCVKFTAVTETLRLDRLTALEEFDATNTSIGDDTVASLPPSVRVLCLDRTNVSTASAEWCSRLPALVYVKLATSHHEPAFKSALPASVAVKA